LFCIYITFFFHGTQELLLFKKLFLLLHQDGFDTLFQQKNDFILSAKFQKLM